MSTNNRTWALAVALAAASCAGAVTEAESPQTEPKGQESAEPMARADGDDTSAGGDAAEGTEPGEVKPQQREEETKAKAPPSSPTERLMRAHFSQAEALRMALVAGDPGLAGKKANELINSPDEKELPAAAQPHIVRMKEAADRVRDSSDVAQAAAAAADIGVACGLCHSQFGGPEAVDTPAPDAGDSVKERMKVHVWATERLWEGLYVPSRDSWQEGVEALQGKPFSDEVLSQGGVYARSAAKDFERLVDEAFGKSRLPEQASVYARLLVTCARCHLAME